MVEQNEGESIGQYRLMESRPAEGATAARLWKAVDRTTGQNVLLRLLDPLASRNKQMRHALEELRDPANPRRVQDPHIVRTLDVGTRGEAYYVVFEDFGGVPLDEHLREGRPSLREGLRLAREIAECLRAVHGHKLVHGDLKPQNILVGRDKYGKPVVKIALADLACHAADAMVSIYGELVGTPKYLAPEQILGRRATGVSDVFALGVIFYEMFSGREPFPAEGPLGYLHANASADAPPLAGADPSVPADLGRIVMRMLARDPKRRYRSAQALVDDLERIEARLDGIAPEAVPAGADSVFAGADAATSSPAAMWRSVALASLAAAVILLVAAIWALVVLAQKPSGPPRC